MDKLSDFKPLHRVSLPGLESLKCAGLIVFVGPNSSGKTQLLRDITQRVSGEPRKLVVASTVDVATPDHELFMKCLKKEGYINSTWNDNDEEQFVPTTPFLGAGQAAKNVGSNQLTQWKSRSTIAANRNRRDEYRGWLSMFLVTVLFLENRLVSLKTVQTIDFENQPPANDLHALHLNDKARAALSSEVERAFSKAIWTCSARGNQLSLRIAEEGGVPDAKARLSVSEMAKFRTIESEGDGMKSYVATVISLLLGRRPITVIDEPELCLHPPQAYNLGQFIGKVATSEQTATFVATHSSQILRGIVQAAETLQIVRLTRHDGVFTARLVESEILAEAMKKPTVRAETVLDGIFARAVAVIEGDGDRVVYHAAWEKVGQSRNFDVHFASVGGAGGISDTCQLYRVLGIPVCVIADLDVLTDVPKIRQILHSLAVDSESLTELMIEVESIAEELGRLPPTIAEHDAKQRLAALAAAKYDWRTGDDKTLRTEVSKLRAELDGMRRLKSGGVSALPDAIRARVESVVGRIAEAGFFLVPVGELEGWLSQAGLKASKAKKWLWANEAATYLRDSEPRDEDIWAFIGQVGEYLASQMTSGG